MKTTFEKPLIASLLIYLLFFGGCSKKSTATSATKSNTDYLTSAAWLIKDYQEDVGIDGTIDYTSKPSACQQDATYSFGTNNILTYVPAATPCDSTDVESITTWALTAKDTVLSFSGYA